MKLIVGLDIVGLDTRYSKYKKYLSMIMMLICIKQRLSNFSQCMKKLSNTQTKLKKALLIKNVYLIQMFLNSYQYFRNYTTF